MDDPTTPRLSPPAGPDVRSTGLWGLTTHPDAADLCVGFTNYYSGDRPNIVEIGNWVRIGRWPQGAGDPTIAVQLPVTRAACFRIAMQFLQMAQYHQWPDDDPGIFAPPAPDLGDPDSLGRAVARLQSMAADLRAGDLDPLRSARTREVDATAIEAAIAALAKAVPGVDEHPDRARYAERPETP